MEHWPSISQYDRDIVVSIRYDQKSRNRKKTTVRQCEQLSTVAVRYLVQPTKDEMEQTACVEFPLKIDGF